MQHTTLTLLGRIANELGRFFKRVGSILCESTLEHPESPPEADDTPDLPGAVFKWASGDWVDQTAPPTPEPEQAPEPEPEPEPETAQKGARYTPGVDLLYLRSNFNGATAVAAESQDRKTFTVFAGATGRRTPPPSFKKTDYAAARDKLIADRVMVETTDDNGVYVYELPNDHNFSSPARAASVLLCRAAGLKEWHTINGDKLHDLIRTPEPPVEPTRAPYEPGVHRLWLTSNDQGARAEAVETPDRKRFVVLAGARARYTTTPSFDDTDGDNRRRALIDKGVMVERTISSGQKVWEFTRDFGFSSPSHASSVLMGRASGRKDWVNEHGISLAVLLADAKTRASMT